MTYVPRRLTETYNSFTTTVPCLTGQDDILKSCGLARHWSNGTVHRVTHWKNTSCKDKAANDGSGFSDSMRNNFSYYRTTKLCGVPCEGLEVDATNQTK